MNVLIRWFSADPAALAARLRDAGLPVESGEAMAERASAVARSRSAAVATPPPVARLRLVGGVVHLISGPARAGDRLELADGAAARDAPAAPANDAPGAPAPGDRPPRLVAVGWATVDVERVAGASGERTTELARDRLLGARAVLLGEGPVLLLEPDTEARIAATLARHGEGPAAIYLADLPTTVDGRTVPGASSVTPGPFGRAVLLVPALLHGPHLIACDGRPVASTTIAT